MPRLKTYIAVQALLRRAENGGAFATIIKKGDDIAGNYIVICRTQTEPPNSYIIYRPMPNETGQFIWWPKGPLNQEACDLYINRRIDEDPDIWVVEISDKAGRHFLLEPVETDEAVILSDEDKALKAAIKAVFPDPSRR